MPGLYDSGMADDKRVSQKEAQAREADLLADYGLDQDQAVKLIKDARKAGGIDRFLRELARKGN